MTTALEEARKAAEGLSTEERAVLIRMVKHMDVSEFRKRVGFKPWPASFDPSSLPRFEKLGIFTASRRSVTPASENIGVVVSTDYTITPLGREVAAMLKAAEHP
jgi:hypothetical protein